MSLFCRGWASRVVPVAQEQPPEVEVTPPEEGGEGAEIAKTPTDEAPVKRELSESPDRQRTRPFKGTETDLKSSRIP